jgi:hypothetical protein
LIKLFFRSDAFTRQLSAPLVDERRQYLTQCAAQGMSRRTLRTKARLLLSIAEYLRLATRPDDTISLPEMKKRQAKYRRRTNRAFQRIERMIEAMKKQLSCQTLTGFSTNRRIHIAPPGSPMPKSCLRSTVDTALVIRE